jgi:hypothetical protein
MTYTFVFNNISTMNWPFEEHKPNNCRERIKREIVVAYDYILRFDLTF